MNILGAFRFQCSLQSNQNLVKAGGFNPHDRLGGLHYCGYAINATKPAMTGNGKHTTEKNGGGWCKCRCFTHNYICLVVEPPL